MRFQSMMSIVDLVQNQDLMVATWRYEDGSDSHLFKYTSLHFIYTLLSDGGSMGSGIAVAIG